MVHLIYHSLWLGLPFEATPRDVANVAVEKMRSQEIAPSGTSVANRRIFAASKAAGALKVNKSLGKQMPKALRVDRDLSCKDDS